LWPEVGTASTITLQNNLSLPIIGYICRLLKVCPIDCFKRLNSNKQRTK